MSASRRPSTRARLLVLAAALVACQPVTASAPTSAPAVPTAPGVSTQAIGATQTVGAVFVGAAFDKCTAPLVSEMGTWWSASPYRAAGLYLGGNNAACPPSSVPHLNAQWVTDVGNQGWGLLPLWVGPQAPCYGGSGAKISTSTATAATEGTAQANAAADVATAFGIGPTAPIRREPGQGGAVSSRGSPIYYDLEHYNATGDQPCITAVLSFVDAWVDQLHARGYEAGFYSSGSSGIAHQVAAFQAGWPYSPPDELWIADWNNKPNTYGSKWVPDNLWYHHRLHQYRGGHNETWGGVTFNIDNNASDGLVTRPATPSPSDWQGPTR
jgi:hypothetical protein